MKQIKIKYVRDRNWIISIHTLVSMALKLISIDCRTVGEM